MTERLALKPAEAAKALGIGRNQLYELVRDEGLPHIRIGRRIVIPRRELEDWLAARLERATSEGGAE